MSPKPCLFISAMYAATAGLPVCTSGLATSARPMLAEVYRPLAWSPATARISGLAHVLVMYTAGCQSVRTAS